MSALSMSAAEFYTLRDDRTNRCTVQRDYQNTACTVRLTPCASATRAGQTAFLAAANLLSRWCRQVDLIAPACRLDPAFGMGDSDLIEFALSQMRDADPFGTFRRAEAGAPQCGIALCIGGGNAVSGAVRSVFVDSRGWLAAISLDSATVLGPDAGDNCLGALAAAALGVGQVFKLALRIPEEQLLRNGVFDLFMLAWTERVDAGGWPADTRIGRILMVGSGSVGSSAAYCMRLAGLSGDLTVLDKDIVKIENFNRSAIFGCSGLGLSKAEATSRFLGGSALQCQPLPIWWNDFVRVWDRAGAPFDVWLPLANEFGVRYSMQQNVPPLMIHASTTANWGVNHARHIPTSDDCLADRFPAQATEKDLACATGEVTVQDVTVDAALPFCSFFAGLLIVADLVRANLPGYPQIANFALFDWFGPMETIHAWDRKPRPDCICRQQGQSLHSHFNAGTRHWPVFRFNA
jgi:hypothetical protein